jgi:tRNA-specific 2-thiouridylase
VHWIRNDLSLTDGQSFALKARIRYRQPLESCTLYKKTEGIYIIFEKPQRGVTPGQFAAWYQDDELLGSGVIS